MLGEPQSQHGTDPARYYADLAARRSKLPRERFSRHFTEPRIVEAVFTITTSIGVSKFGDAPGVSREPVFNGIKPLLRMSH